MDAEGVICERRIRRAMGRPRLLGAVGLVAIVLAGLPATAGSASTCVPDPATSASFSAAQTTRGLLCLVNAERAARGLRTLRPSTLLERAARRHAEDLVARRYFAHVSPEGLLARDRIRLTGYLDRAVRWKLGEVLGYGRAVPHAAVALSHGFMNSALHRRLLLHPRFERVGIGVATGWPVEGRRSLGVTTVVNLGYVRPG